MAVCLFFVPPPWWPLSTLQRIKCGQGIRESSNLKSAGKTGLIKTICVTIKSKRRVVMWPNAVEWLWRKGKKKPRRWNQTEQRRNQPTEKPMSPPFGGNICFVNHFRTNRALCLCILDENWCRVFCCYQKTCSDFLLEIGTNYVDKNFLAHVQATWSKFVVFGQALTLITTMIYDLSWGNVPVRNAFLLATDMRVPIVQIRFQYAWNCDHATTRFAQRQGTGDS